MSIRDPSDLEALRAVGRVVALTIRTMADWLGPGITTHELDRIGEAVLEDHGARSAPRLCVDFPAATCISINNEAAHGIPGDRAVADGDLVNIDVSAELNGFFADAGASFPVGEVDRQGRELCASTRRGFDAALASLRPDARFSEVGRQVEREARRNRLHAIRNLCSHGVGRWLHEEPLQILNYHDRADPRRFKEGMVIALEAFMATGTPWVEQAEDGWTMLTTDGGRAAQYEHTVVVTADGPLVLTSLD